MQIYESFLKVRQKRQNIVSPTAKPASDTHPFVKKKEAFPTPCLRTAFVLPSYCLPRNTLNTTKNQQLTHFGGMQPRGNVGNTQVYQLRNQHLTTKRKPCPAVADSNPSHNGCRDLQPHRRGQKVVPNHSLNPTLVLPKFCLTDALPMPYRCLTENSL